MMLDGEDIKRYIKEQNNNLKNTRRRLNNTPKGIEKFFNMFLP